MNQRAKDRITVALDVDSPEQGIKLVERLEPHVGCFKIGLEFMHVMLHALLRPAVGPGQIQDIRDMFSLLKEKVFWDGKLHDIPNTVSGASDIIAKLGVRQFNVHVSGGTEMMRAAKQAAISVQERSGYPHPIRVLGVTVLTSLKMEDLLKLGLSGGASDDPMHDIELKRSGMKFLVRTMARLAKESGLDGVVCSPEEIETVRNACGKDFYIVTPGIRPAHAATNDQKRVMTPGEAIRAGANELVIGRPITAAHDPVEAVGRIAEEIDAALKEVR